MSEPHQWMNVHNSRRRLSILAALVGALLLLGLSCHPPQGLGLATGHTHSGQPSIGHCWTAISGFPMMSFVALLVVLLSLPLTFQGHLFGASPFKPPRAR